LSIAWGLKLWQPGDHVKRLRQTGGHAIGAATAVAHPSLEEEYQQESHHRDDDDEDRGIDHSPDGLLG